MPTAVAYAGVVSIVLAGAIWLSAVIWSAVGVNLALAVMVGAVAVALVRLAIRRRRSVSPAGVRRRDGSDRRRASPR
jgi:hypothetical protein